MRVPRTPCPSPIIRELLSITSAVSEVVLNHCSQDLLLPTTSRAIKLYSMTRCGNRALLGDRGHSVMFLWMGERGVLMNTIGTRCPCRDEKLPSCNINCSRPMRYSLRFQPATSGCVPTLTKTCLHFWIPEGPGWSCGQRSCRSKAGATTPLSCWSARCCTNGLNTAI